MRIGILMGIHSNLPALEAVLHAAASAHCSHWICCHGLLGIGPYPAQVVKRIRQMSDCTVTVTAEEANNRGPKAYFTSLMSSKDILFSQWQSARLSTADAVYLQTLPRTVSLEAEGHVITVVPNSTALIAPTAEQLAAAYADVPGDILLYPPTMMPLCVQKDGRYFFNVEPVGCPPPTRSGASYGILDVTADAVTFERHVVSYEIQQILDEYCRLNIPNMEMLSLMYFHRRMRNTNNPYAVMKKQKRKRSSFAAKNSDLRMRNP